MKVRRRAKYKSALRGWHLFHEVHNKTYIVSKCKIYSVPTCGKKGLRPTFMYRNTYKLTLKGREENMLRMLSDEELLDEEIRHVFYSNRKGAM